MRRRIAHDLLRSPRGVAAPLVLLLLTASQGDVATEPELAACSPGTELTVEVDAGATTLRWSPPCLVSFVAVVDSAGVASWAIRTPGGLRALHALTTPAGKESRDVVLASNR